MPMFSYPSAISHDSYPSATSIIISHSSADLRLPCVPTTADMRSIKP